MHGGQMLDVFGRIMQLRFRQRPFGPIGARLAFADFDVEQGFGKRRVTDLCRMTE